ncbi:MAG: hypothetical protein RIQ41_249 [Candidatus Parcubacteria bacterium]|jgi:hypothetical protein
MKLIASGWQYKVYDLENGRVRKVKASGLFQYIKILSHLPFQFIEAYKEQQRVNRMERQANDYIRTILHLEISRALGNPVFISQSDYEQDKVRVLYEVCKDASFEQQKEIIKSYIHLIHTTWNYGFADCIFNFTLNNGTNDRGDLLQLDFGEITTEKDDVEEMIRNQRWLQSFSYTTLVSNELKDYYSTTMSEELTFAKLNESWRSKLK